MKLIAKISPVLITGLFLVAAPADAATVFLDAAAGHPFLSSGQVNWETTWTTTSIKILDGRNIVVGSATSSGQTVRTWVIHIPITGSNQNWSSTSRGTGAGVPQRICSFTPNGSFSNCGASVSFGVASTVLVPLDGTAFSQSTLVATSGVSSSMLSSIKANN